MAIGVVERELQAQHGIDAGGEGDLTADSLRRDVSEGFEFIHAPNYTLLCDQLSRPGGCLSSPAAAVWQAIHICQK